MPSQLFGTSDFQGGSCKTGGQTALQAGVETRQTWDHRAESKKWLTRYFLRTMTALHISLRDAPQLTHEELATVKNENGAKFGSFSSDKVDTQAIGRGTTTPISIL